MKQRIMFLGLLAVGVANAQQYDEKVGINTEVPSATLNVKTKTGNDGTTKNLELERQDGKKMVTVLNNGHMGIGTQNPLAPLHIVPKYDFYNPAQWNSINGQTNKYATDAILIDVLHGEQNSATRERRRSISSNIDRTANTLYRGHRIDFGMVHLNGHTQPFMAFAVGPQSGTTPNADVAVEHMRITDTGRIGIGTSAPTNKLHIKADANPLKLEGLQNATGADNKALVVGTDGVVKLGVASASSGATTIGKTDNITCDANTRGKMNFAEITKDGSTFDVLGVCMKNSNGNYYWRYFYGGMGNTTGTGTFGSGF